MFAAHVATVALQSQPVHCFVDTLILVVDRPPNSIKGAHDSTAIPGAGLPSPAKPRTLAVQLVASATPSAADNVNMGSPPAPMNPNKKSVDGLAVISGNPNKPELSATSPKVRGHAVQLRRFQCTDTVCGTAMLSAPADICHLLTPSFSTPELQLQGMLNSEDF